MRLAQRRAGAGCACGLVRCENPALTPAFPEAKKQGVIMVDADFVRQVNAKRRA